MKYFSSRYNNFFNAGLLLVLITILYVRPLQSPWHPFIAGDGLGYYAYLPAKFIHNDPQLDFKWFNRVYSANYVYSSFDNPEDNLLVAYKGKRINKYYQGLAYIWMPFFIAGHIIAKVFHFPPDGFSAPYQYMIGLASVFYLFLGLVFLRLLLQRLFMVRWVAVLVPFLFFFGTPLYSYAIFANSLSHAYSFTFICGFLYFALRFFRDPGKKTMLLILSAVFFVITVCIRPINGLSIFLLAAFVPVDFLKHKIVFEKLRFMHYVILSVGIGAIIYQLQLTYIQTGSVVAYTYTDEKFDFANNHFVDAIFSYHMGMAQYFPLLLIGMFGLCFANRRMALVLSIVFIGIVFLYSSWWYWPIVKRALVDFYAVPAIGVAAMLVRLKTSVIRTIAITFLLSSVLFFQFKNWQIGAGILDEFLTYKELYWRHFLRTRKANIFPIPPSSIVAVDERFENFESAESCQYTPEAKAGKKALLLDQTNFICTVKEDDFPPLFSRPERRKIRLSFDLYCEEGEGQVHAFIDFKSAKDSSLLQIPFYIASDHLYAGVWDHKEFGYDLSDRKLLNSNQVAKIKIIIWNVEGKRALRVDELRMEYLLTNESFETNK